MKTTDIIRRAGRSLKQAKARTLLTSLAISVGAFTVTMALAAGTGTQAYTNTLVKNNGDARIVSIFPKYDASTGPGASSEPREYGAASTPTGRGMLTDADIEKVKSLPDIAEVTPLYTVSATYMTRGGDAKKYETSLTIKTDQTEVPLAAGSLERNRVAKGSVVVPEDYLKVLGFEKPEDAIGKALTLRIDKLQRYPLQEQEGKDVTLTIAAVDKKSSTSFVYAASLRISPADGKEMYDFQNAGLSKASGYYGADARVKDDVDVKVAKKAVEDAGYSAFTLQDLQEALFQFINVAQWGAAGFGFLAILASVFGIINTQYISVLERTQQIGLMKALGAHRRDVGRLFRYEAAWVGFLGGALGTVAALLFGLLNPVIAKALDLEPGTNLLLFEPLTSVILIASLMLIAMLAGYFPSHKAANLDPIEALRTE